MPTSRRKPVLALLLLLSMLLPPTVASAEVTYPPSYPPGDSDNAGGGGSPGGLVEQAHCDLANGIGIGYADVNGNGRYDEGVDDVITDYYPPCFDSNYRWTSQKATCETGVYVFRYYGTASVPVQAWTVSTGNQYDACDNDQRNPNYAIYLPHPHDSGSAAGAPFYTSSRRSQSTGRDSSLDEKGAITTEPIIASAGSCRSIEAPATDALDKLLAGPAGNEILSSIRAKVGELESGGATRLQALTDLNLTVDGWNYSDSIRCGSVLDFVQEYPEGQTEGELANSKLYGACYVRAAAQHRAFMHASNGDVWWANPGYWSPEYWSSNGPDYSTTNYASANLRRAEQAFVDVIPAIVDSRPSMFPVSGAAGLTSGQQAQREVSCQSTLAPALCVVDCADIVERQPEPVTAVLELAHPAAAQVGGAAGDAHRLQARFRGIRCGGGPCDDRYELTDLHGVATLRSPAGFGVPDEYSPRSGRTFDTIRLGRTTVSADYDFFLTTPPTRPFQIDGAASGTVRYTQTSDGYQIVIPILGGNDIVIDVGGEPVEVDLPVSVSKRCVDQSGNATDCTFEVIGGVSAD